MRIFLVLLIALASCKTSTPEKVPSPSVEPIATVPIPSPVGGTVTNGYVKLVPDEYYTTKAERELIKKAEAKSNEVRTSDCTFNFISKRKMIQTDGRTPLQVATEVKAMSGSVPVQFYYSRFTSARAYRNEGEPTIYLNRKFIGPNSNLCEVAGTINHESLHSLKNFGHDFNWSASREYSVPYSYDHAFAPEAYSMSDSGGCCK